MLQSPFNKSRQDKFIISFELPKLMKAHKYAKFFDNYTSFQVFKANIPKISVEAKQIPYAGQHLAISSHVRPQYDPLNIQFNVDNYWKNYYTIYWWINVQNDDALSYVDTHNVFGDIQTNEILKYYRTDITLTQLDEYNNPIIHFKYLDAFPSSLAEVDDNHQAVNEITMTVTWNYSQFIPEFDSKVSNILQS